MDKRRLRGTKASLGRVQGKVYKVYDTTKPVPAKPGCILVAEFTTPIIALALTQAGGIVCETGGVTCHAAIISRELNKPCLVGVKGAMTRLSDGQEVILDVDKGMVYAAES